MADQRRDPDQRPSPEALLEAARREESRAGKLKIFVGAAPGVGKTYEMLQQARARKQDGYDVVVGVVETHGRKETEALLEGLEIVPRRRIEYKGQWLEEMDLDAIIARRPQIVLVDELAHTNAPGSRHPKRYLDVEELLNRGIDVYTHRQHPAHREPERRRRADHPCARARDGAGLGLRPRRRRRAGRPHARRPDPAPQGRQGLRPQAGRARARAFLLAGQPDGACASWRCAAPPSASTSNCSRRCRRTPSQGPWAAGERILVCVSEDPRAAGLVRYAKRLADRLHAPWTALYVETGAACSSPRRSATASPTRCGWPRRSGGERSRSRRRPRALPTT